MEQQGAHPKDSGGPRGHRKLTLYAGEGYWTQTSGARDEGDEEAVQDEVRAARRARRRCC